MQIRVATREDIPAIKELYWVLDTDAIHYHPELFVRTERPEDFLLGIIEGDKSDFLLIEENENIIGFALLQEKETGNISCLIKKRYAYILDFVIAEDERSKGFGATLLEAAKEWGRERAVDFLRLSVFEENERGIQFYERQGLKAVMRTMDCEV